MNRTKKQEDKAKNNSDYKAKLLRDGGERLDLFRAK